MAFILAIFTYILTSYKAAHSGLTSDPQWKRFKVQLCMNFRIHVFKNFKLKLYQDIVSYLL